MQHSIQIRSYQEGDEKAIYEIILDNDHYDQMSPERKIKYAEFHSPKKLKQFIQTEKPDILLAIVDGEKVGTIIRLKNRFFRLHILRGYTRNGIGTLLIKKMMKQCKRDGFTSAYIKPLRESTQTMLHFMKKNKIEIEKLKSLDQGATEIYFKL